MAEKLTPEYMDFIYRNTGGKMGKPLPKQNAPQTPPPVETPRRKYELPNNGLSKFLVALGGGNPANIDQIALQAAEHRSMFDPESERSRIARDIAMKVGAPSSPDLAAADIESFLPSYERLLALKARGQGAPKEKPTSDKVKGEYGERLAGLNALIQNQNLLKKSPEVGFGKEIAYQLPWVGDILRAKLSPEDVSTASEIGKNVNLAVRGANAGYNVTDSDFARLSPLFASPFERSERAQEKNLAAIKEQAQNQKMRAESDYKLGIIDSKTYQEAIDAADNALYSTGATNISSGKGDVTKEVWILPNGQERHVSPTSEKYNAFVKEAQAVGGKRIK